MRSTLKIQSGPADPCRISLCFEDTDTALICVGREDVSVNEMVDHSACGTFPFHDIFPPLFRFGQDGLITDVFIPLEDRLFEGTIAIDNTPRAARLVSPQGNIMTAVMPITAVCGTSLFTLEADVAPANLMASKIGANMISLTDEAGILRGVGAEQYLAGCPNYSEDIAPKAYDLYGQFFELRHRYFQDNDPYDYEGYIETLERFYRVNAPQANGAPFLLDFFAQNGQESTMLNAARY